MKGLILKDFYTSIKELRLYFVIMALFILASFVSEDMYFMAIYPCLICGMFPQSLMAFDERSKWENYCGTFPIKNKDIVSSKYIFTIIIILITTCVSAILHGIRFAISETYTTDTYMLTVVSIFVLSCIAVAIQLPFNFKYGAEKGRIGYYLIVIITSFGSVVSGKYLTGDQQIQMTDGMILFALIVIAIVCYGVSWLLSIKFYNKRNS